MNKLSRVAAWGLVLAAGSAQAAPFRSLRGLIHVPSAYAVGHHVIEIAASADAYRPAVDAAFQFEGDVRLTVGLERFELGFTALTDQLYAGQFKFQFLDEVEDAWVPALAWGIRDLSLEPRLTSTGTDSPYDYDQNNALFLVASKRFGTVKAPLTLHVGIGTGGFRPDRGFSRVLQGAFVGIELPFAFIQPDLDFLAFLLEMDGKHLNAGFRVKLPQATLGIAASALERSSGSDVVLGVGEGFRIGAGLIISSQSLGLW